MAEAHPFERRWPGLADEYETLRDRAEAAVARWRWAPPDAMLHRPEPLYGERSELPARGLLAGEPAVTRDVMEYGYDGKGRIVVARRHQFGNRDEDLYFRDGDRVESVRFGVAPRGAVGSEMYATPQVLHEYFYEAGRIVGCRSYAGRYGWASERYEYDGERVVGIEYSAALPEREEREQWVAQYDELGRLSVLREQISDTVVYERSPEPTDKLLKRVEKMLMATIPEVVGVLAPSQPIACIGLGYDLGVTSPLPPVVGVCTATEQAALFDVDAVEAWNPWAFPHLTGDPEAAFASLTPDPAAFAAASRALRDDDDALRDLVVGVAGKLRKRGTWPSGVVLADDVIVFAVDGEMEDLERNLKEALRRGR